MHSLISHVLNISLIKLILWTSFIRVDHIHQFGNHCPWQCQLLKYIIWLLSKISRGYLAYMFCDLNADSVSAVILLEMLTTVFSWCIHFLVVSWYHLVLLFRDLRAECLYCTCSSSWFCPSLFLDADHLSDVADSPLWIPSACIPEFPPVLQWQKSVIYRETAL